MSKVLDFLKGKKTYLIIATGFIVGGLQAVGVDIPPYVYGILGGLGLWTFKAGVNRIEKPTE